MARSKHLNRKRSIRIPLAQPRISQKGSDPAVDRRLKVQTLFRDSMSKRASPRLQYRYSRPKAKRASGSDSVSPEDRAPPPVEPRHTKREREAVSQVDGHQASKTSAPRHGNELQTLVTACRQGLTFSQTTHW